MVDRDKALAWMAKGAMPTETVQSLLKQAGVFNPAPSVVEQATEAVTGTAKKAAKAVSGAASGAAAAVSSAASAVSGAVASAASAVADAARDSGAAVPSRPPPPPWRVPRVTRAPRVPSRPPPPPWRVPPATWWRT